MCRWVAHFTDADCGLRCMGPTGAAVNPQGPDPLSSAWLPPFNSPLSASPLVVCLRPSSPSLPDLFDSTFVQYPVRLIGPLYLSLTSLNAPSSSTRSAIVPTLPLAFTLDLARLYSCSRLTGLFPGLSFMSCTEHLSLPLWFACFGP